jgi:hypothetical protein
MARLTQRPPAFRHGRAVAALCALALLLSACGRREPVTGFFGYRWGTPMDSVLADSAAIATRLAESGFLLEREPGGLRLYHVQYGLGYGEVRLEFDPQGALWHGAVRVEAQAAQADSIHDAWRDHHGRETAPGRIDTDSGYTTFWFSGSTVDRHYFAPAWSAAAPRTVRALDLFYGGCLMGCPLYSVRLLADGRALLHAVREVDPLGCYAGTWNAQRFPRLSELANDPEIRALESFYCPTTDRGLASRGLSVHFEDGRTVAAVSVEQSGPPALEQLLAALDSVATGVVWEHQVVQWDTLDLRAAQWIDLDSLERLTAR